MIMQEHERFSMSCRRSRKVRLALALVALGTLVASLAVSYTYLLLAYPELELEIRSRVIEVLPELLLGLFAIQVWIWLLRGR